MSSLPENVINFLEQEYQKNEQGPNDFNVNEAMELWGLSRNATTGRLNELVKEGKLVRLHGRLSTGRTGNFYRIVSS